MSTWYQDIEPVQQPFDVGLDSDGRAQVVFNIDVVKRPSNTFLEEVAQILVDAGVGTWNTDIFGSSSKDIPIGDGPYLSIVETGGAFGLRTHNVGGAAYERPSASITVRARTYAAARTMSNAAHAALDGFQNTNVTVSI